MCLSRGSSTPPTPEPPAPAAAPASAIEPKLDSNKKTKSGELRDKGKGKRKFRVDSKGTGSTYGGFTGLNIPN